ncbi:MAG: cation diffusion facilitator family transporter [Alphaproteobacteria bacterium]|nr:cation diffusion facilitator family transporter [Alphaproteobacteria bacterium]
MKSLINKQDESFLKKFAAIASISTAFVLTLIKTYAAFMTGSLSVLSSLIDSLSDILASIITFVAVHYSDKPLTNKHRYGYGKAESVSALLQSAFIIGSAGFILYDGFYRFANPRQIEETMFGIIIMSICWIITLALILLQKYTIKRVHSQAINADSGHYTVDLLSNGSVIVSLFVVKYLHWMWFDVATAVLIALYLLYNAGVIAYEALEEITDKEINEADRQKIINAVTRLDGVLGCHDFRSRISGSTFFVELHLEFDGNKTLYETHKISDIAESEIVSLFPQAQVIIHQDPYGLKEKRLDHDIEKICKL